uniref:THIF-type NAD/FAD binding fold domain-containing protein n=1 Tax=Geospiza parvula TaxID=87175 RepID=A0A8U8AYT7_GEOPR
MRGLGAEVAKNLILAGVRGLTLLDHQQVRGGTPGGTVGTQGPPEPVCLNPMVEVKARRGRGGQTDPVPQCPQVCLTCCSKESMVRINQICHKNGIKFFTGDVFGYHGYMFADLGQHEFVEEKPKVAKVSAGVEDGPEAKRARLEPAETTMVKKQLQFCPLREALAVRWRGEEAAPALRRTAPDYFLLHVLLQFRTEAGRDPCPRGDSDSDNDSDNVPVSVLLHSCFSEMAPVCAVVGGVLGQEVVKALSQRDPPHNNFFFFDGVRGQGMVERLGPPPK